MLRTSLARFARVATNAAYPICEAGALAPARWVADQQSSQLFVSSSGSSRGFASEPAAADSADVSTIGNAKVQKLADEIVGLTVLESSWLTEILRKKLNLTKPAYGAMAMAPMGAMPAAAPAAAPAAEAAKPAEKKEKTEFDVKLESFTAEGKIKVIKEIRAITSLGLKEAKELVEKAPIVIKAGVSKADAENFKKLIEAAGAKVTLA